MSLPQNLPLGLTQTQWGQQLNPIIANPANNSIILQQVQLFIGMNTIKHGLGRVLQGWSIVRHRAYFLSNVQTNYNIYDVQDGGNGPTPIAPNPTPQYTLILNCDQGIPANAGILSNPVIVDIEVF